MSDLTIRQRKALHRRAYPEPSAFWELVETIGCFGFVITVCCLIVLGWRA